MEAALTGSVVAVMLVAGDDRSKEEKRTYQILWERRRNRRDRERG